MNQPLRIYLLDDHPIVRQGLRMVIEKEADMQIVGESGLMAPALPEIADAQPDVVLMDLRLPDGDGIEATRLIKRNKPDIQVLVLTENDNIAMMRSALAAGATGYLLKLSAVETLLTAIRAAVHGSLFFDPHLKEKVASLFLAPSYELKPHTAEVELSSREENVLRLLALGNSHKEIATQLNIGLKTVETYRKRACEKLGLQGRNAIVRYALSKGWLSHPK